MSEDRPVVVVIVGTSKVRVHVECRVGELPWKH